MGKKQITKPLIPKDKELIEIMGRLGRLNTKFNDRRFTVGDTDLSYRVISHWHANHLLPEGVKEDEGWHKFSLVEIVWLKSVTHLRNFGFSLKKISQIKKQVMVFDKKNDCYPMFELYVFKAWFTSDNPCIVLLADGTADIGDALEIELAKDRKQQDMLLIPMKSVLEEIGGKTKRAKFLMPLNYDESIALQALASTEKELVIRKSGGKIKEIETLKNIGENISPAEINKEFKESNGFGEMTIRFGEGKMQSMQVRNKRRLGK